MIGGGSEFILRFLACQKDVTLMIFGFYSHVIKKRISSVQLPFLLFAWFPNIFSGIGGSDPRRFLFGRSPGLSPGFTVDKSEIWLGDRLELMAGLLPEAVFKGLNI